jgi:transposase-like protein
MMMKRTPEFWQGHVEAAKREGTTTSKYAARHGVPIKSLYRWQRKLMASSVAASPMLASAFVALRVADAVTASAAANCSLMLGGGLRLDLSALPPSDWLAALVRAAQGAR